MQLKSQTHDETIRELMEEKLKTAQDNPLLHQALQELQTLLIATNLTSREVTQAINQWKKTTSKTEPTQTYGQLLAQASNTVWCGFFWAEDSYAAWLSRLPNLIQDPFFYASTRGVLAPRAYDDEEEVSKKFQ